MKRIHHALLLPVLALALAGPVDAQLITGRLVLEGEGRGIGDAEIVLLNSADAAVARALTDSTGAFSLSVPAPGHYVIRAGRIGLATVRAQVEVAEKEYLEVELTTSERAIPVEPIVVVARRRIRQGTLDEFYDRMERMKQRGQGRFLTREDLEGLERRSLPMAIASVPGVWSTPSSQEIQLMGNRGLCRPDVYLDGVPLDGAGGNRSRQALSTGASRLYPFGDGGGASLLRGYNGIPVIDLEGVEIYRAYERADGYFPSRCGTIFLWRKDDWGNPFGWTRLFIAGGLTAGLLLLFL